MGFMCHSGETFDSAFTLKPAFETELDVWFCMVECGVLLFFGLT